MKFISTILLVSCLIAFTSCNPEPKDLTPPKAKRAFEKICGQRIGEGRVRTPDGGLMMGPSDIEPVTIDGIRTDKIDGMTVVDATLQTYRYTNASSGPEVYTGPAIGYFRSYTDGRFALTRLELTKDQARGNTVTVTFQKNPTTD